MRLGVLDVGSNTVHLLVVDAHRGAHPTPMHDDRSLLRLAEHVDADDRLSKAGEKALVRAVQKAQHQAEQQGCEQLLALVTSAIREATNGLEVLERVRERTGVRLEVLSGEDEARLTFLAVRRWFGWSAGRLSVFDIGGGSLEIAGGADEAPDVAWSLPLGAARLARQHFAGGRADEDTVRELRRQVRAAIAHDAGRLLRSGAPDHAAATSKTFRSLARIFGAAPSAEGPLVPRLLPLAALTQWIPKLTAMGPGELAALPGVSPSRSHQVLPGALVAEAVMDIFDLPALEICPWALREGVILERLDRIAAEL
jgi:exopolyphosphatase/guanosine-5'-triphosphate,3'-diphosphate pyrophosphatase